MDIAICDLKIAYISIYVRERSKHLGSGKKLKLIFPGGLINNRKFKGIF
jgi:hypothetical protein